ncbi:MAG: nicotinate-nucleotide--dimethylbenzimidazole phosphoribosyltransferase [Oscillospiraceae bacterium]|nr:nicotinate-nucleotide--dimethylbenzimidazole phosphoribosyltransferase [Oscillospiraceae bacterium]
MEKELIAAIRAISPPDREAMSRAEKRQAALAKPPGSLGKLEELSVRLAGITGKVNNRISKTRVIVLAADNGVVEEGVSSAPQSVTLAQAVNLTRALTGASSMAAYFGDGLQVVDVGINARVDCPDILDRKIAMGSANMVRQPAMTREQAVRAVEIGMELARAAKDDGVDIIGVGEMGIGNTTTSSAVLSALLSLPAQAVTGRGGGLTDEGFAKKKTVIETALALHRPDPDDPLDVLSKVGGFDIAAMCGVFLGAAACSLPVVIDGFISITAALCAARLCGNVKAYLIPSHASFEKGYAAAAAELGVQPYLLLDMRLGEGSGCPLAFRVAEAACAVMNGMATFDGAGINDDYLTEIRANEDICFGRS